MTIVSIISTTFIVCLEVANTPLFYYFVASVRIVRCTARSFRAVFKEYILTFEEQPESVNFLAEVQKFNSLERPSCISREAPQRLEDNWCQY